MTFLIFKFCFLSKIQPRITLLKHRKNIVDFSKLSTFQWIRIVHLYLSTCFGVRTTRNWSKETN